MSTVKGPGGPPAVGMTVPHGMTRPEPKSIQTKFREVSDLYEKNFMREMLKAMRSTVQESGFVKTNQAEKIFREQLDDHYVDKWSEKGGVGFSDIIYDQLMQKYGPVLDKANIRQPHAPIAVDPRRDTSVKFQVTQKTSDGHSDRIDMSISAKDGKWDQSKVVAPWAGTLLNKIALGDDQQALEIDHGNGLLGRYVFKGQLADLEKSSKLEAGQVLGQVSPDAKALYWSLRGPSAPAESKNESTPLQASPDPEDSSLE